MININLLKQARELIADGTHWCTGGFAIDKHNNLTQCSGSDAVKFCAIGAIFKFIEQRHNNGDLLHHNLEIDEVEKAAKKLFNKSIYTVNDRLGLENVLICYDYVINSNGK